LGEANSVAASEASTPMAKSRVVMAASGTPTPTTDPFILSFSKQTAQLSAGATVFSLTLHVYGCAFRLVNYDAFVIFLHCKLVPLRYIGYLLFADAI
jgi:hypothetical protein